MSVPDPPDDQGHRPGRRRFPDDAHPDGLPHPEPDPLDEPDDLLAPEDEVGAADEGPEPEPTPLDDLPVGEDDDDDRTEPSDASEGEGSELSDLADAWLEDEDGDDDDEELPPVGLEDGEPFPLEDEGDDPSLWPEDEHAPPVLEQPFDWADPGEDPIGPGVTEDDWAALEVDEAGLIPGRVIVGLKEFAALPDLGIDEVVARFDTGLERSKLCCTRSETGLLAVDGIEIGACPDDGALRTRVVVGGSTRTLLLDVSGSAQEPPLVLGRDALEGYFVVDVALAFLHRRTGAGSPRTRG